MSFFTGVYTGMLLREAIASVAIEHPAGCACDVCLAAHGDMHAFGRVWAEVDREQERDHDTDRRRNDA